MALSKGAREYYLNRKASTYECDELSDLTVSSKSADKKLITWGYPFSMTVSAKEKDKDTLRILRRW